MKNLIILFCVMLSTSALAQTTIFENAQLEENGTIQTEAGEFTVDITDDVLTVSLTTKYNSKVVSGKIKSINGKRINAIDEKENTLLMFVGKNATLLKTEEFQINLW